ncbi:hypothetical protein SPV_2521 [Streptococcus pneumoniae]|nr:hypothetical protein SPV_2521 [Streptococcus pneumoniae]
MMILFENLFKLRQLSFALLCFEQATVSFRV